ncbi:MAG: mechanosensitive ion channel [Nitrococcus sp.]|nr:mechanosensitive ion channel [Nitrococcus sp.]
MGGIAYASTYAFADAHTQCCNYWGPLLSQYKDYLGESFMRPWKSLPVLAVAVAIGASYAQESRALPQNPMKNITSPSLEAIQPNPVAGTQKRQWITILGSGFTPQSQVVLHLNYETFPIPPERTKFVGDHELRIYVNVSTGPSVWTAQVTNQGGATTRPLSFNVKPIAMIAREHPPDEEPVRNGGIEALGKNAKEIDEPIGQAKAGAQAIGKAAETEIGRLRTELAGLRDQIAATHTFSEKSAFASLIIIIGLFFWFIKKFAVTKFEGATVEKEEVREGSARLRNLVVLLNWLGTIVIVLMVGYLILDEFEISIAPILAIFGILGLALSFGGERLIRDILNGIVILIEGQYNKNDIVQIGSLSGVVESVSLRYTMLRDLEGRAIYIPNGEIKTVINFTKGYGQALLDIRVAYKENVDHVMEVMRRITTEMQRDPQYRWRIGAFEMFGVEELGESDITIRCRVKTLPGKQWDVAREYRRRIKNRFDELGIEIPLLRPTAQWDFSPQVGETTEVGIGSR